MTYPTATKNALLNGLTITQASLHTAFPGSIGANEVTGGSPAYARKNITINAASGGARSLNTGVTFDVPALTIRWIGYWNGSAFALSAPNGGSTPRNFVFSGSTVYSTAHGFTNGQKIVFYSGIPPGGITEGTTYFVIAATTDAFQVAATSGGSQLILSGTAGFSCVVCGITETVYVAQDTHSLNATTIALPD